VETRSNLKFLKLTLILLPLTSSTQEHCNTPVVKIAYKHFCSINFTSNEIVPIVCENADAFMFIEKLRYIVVALFVINCMEMSSLIVPPPLRKININR
jgi:hypothetical protein